MDEELLSEMRNNHRHVMEMLKHLHDEMHEKMDKLLGEEGTELEELGTFPGREEKWLRTIAYQAAKIYGEEHEMAKHYREMFKYVTGKDWDEKKTKD
jgi:hypothetical protein